MEMVFQEKVVEQDGLSFDDVLLVPQKSGVRSRSEPSLQTTFAGDVEIDIPIVSAAMDTVTGPALATTLGNLGGISVIHRFQTVEGQVREVQQVKQEDVQVAAALGINEDWKERASSLVSADVDALVVDIAHGHMERNIEIIRNLSEMTDRPIVAGNIATSDGAVDLAEAGADAVKVGVGPGAYCTTREVTGVGVPQLTAIGNSADAVPEDVCVIADGGIKNSGDAAKALMAGADSVMMGSFFAGTSEAPGEVVEVDGKKYKKARGMATTAANEARDDKEAEEAAPDADEGVEGLTDYTGRVEPRVEKFTGGVRSALSYMGGFTIDEARENAQFIRVYGGAKVRNGAHYDN